MRIESVEALTDGQLSDLRLRARVERRRNASDISAYPATVHWICWTEIFQQYFPGA